MQVLPRRAVKCRAVGGGGECASFYVRACMIVNNACIHVYFCFYFYRHVNVLMQVRSLATMCCMCVASYECAGLHVGAITQVNTPADTSTPSNTRKKRTYVWCAWPCIAREPSDDFCCLFSTLFSTQLPVTQSPALRLLPPTRRRFASSPLSHPPTHTHPHQRVRRPRRS